MARFNGRSWLCFQERKAVKSRSIATLTACSDPHWHGKRWMENVVTHPPVKPLLTFSNIKNKPERLGRQHTRSLCLKIEKAHLVVSSKLRDLRCQIPISQYTRSPLNEGSLRLVQGCPETRKGQNQKRWQVVALTAWSQPPPVWSVFFGVKVKLLRGRLKAKPWPQNARPKGGCYQIFWCCLLVFKD